MILSSYNDRGFVVSQTDQAGKATAFTYNTTNHDNLEKVTTPMGVEKGSAFGHASFKHYPTLATNAQGNQISFGYDPKGNPNLRQNQLAAQNTAEAFYNPNGTVDHTVDGVGNITRHHYYSNTNLQCISGPPAFGQSAPSSPPPSCPGLPAGSQVRQSFTYDNLHRVNTVTDAKGNVSTYAYDALDRVTRVDFAPGGSYMVNVYDNAGRLTSVEDHSGPGPADPFTTTSYTYDALNRQKTKTAAGVTFTSTYDAAGNLKSLADQNGTVTYDYSPVNLLNWVRDPAGAQTNFEYDAAYRRSAVHYPNGVTQTTTYDDDGKVETITGTKAGGTVLTSFEYDYQNPANGKQTELVFKTTEPAGVTAYKYDQVDRLKEATGPTGTFAYEYDGNSNRTKQTINGTDSFFAVDAADQLCHQAAIQAACGSAPAGATSFSYDDNGNLTGQSDGRVLTYNAKDQNTSFKAGGGATSTMGYFGTGQAERTGAAGATFTNGPLGVASSSALLLLNTSYVRDPSGTLVSQKGLLSTHYYLFDRLGSVVALTDGSGTAVNRYVFDPYGNRLAGTVEAVDNPWQFAGGFRDAFSGYTKFGERYYDPSIGRWTQRDPSGMDANSYGYAGANPVNFVDLTGLSHRKPQPCQRGFWQCLHNPNGLSKEHRQQTWKFIIEEDMKVLSTMAGVVVRTVPACLAAAPYGVAVGSAVPVPGASVVGGVGACAAAAAASYKYGIGTGPSAY